MSQLSSRVQVKLVTECDRKERPGAEGGDEQTEGTGCRRSHKSRGHLLILLCKSHIIYTFFLSWRGHMQNSPSKNDNVS